MRRRGYTGRLQQTRSRLQVLPARRKTALGRRGCSRPPQQLRAPLQLQEALGERGCTSCPRLLRALLQLRTWGRAVLVRRGCTRQQTGTRALVQQTRSCRRTARRRHWTAPA
jgi:hypothetical protein